MRPPSTPLVDIGLNLTHESFATDRDAVVARANAAGVTRMLITGSTVASSKEALALARHDPARLRCTAGIHPHHAIDYNEDAGATLLELLRQPEVLAAGECGLDYFRNFSPHEAQVQAFHGQLELAGQVGKPVFLHQRDAHDAFLGIVKEHWPRLAGGVAHCYTGGPSEARSYLDLGLYIGITGWICDERRGQELRQAVRYIPGDRLLVETDAPYLVPRDLRPQPRSRRNEPQFLPHIVRRLAELKGDSPEELAATTTRNALALFRWID